MCWGIWKHPVSAWASASVPAGAATGSTGAPHIPITLGMLWKHELHPAPGQALLTAVWHPQLVEHWRCWCLCSPPPEKHWDFHFLFFISISFPWHPFSWCLDKALGCGHLVSDTRLSPQAAEGHSTRQELLLSNIPHQIHLPLVQGVPVGARTPQKDRQVHRSHSPEDSLPSVHVKNTTKLPHFQHLEMWVCPMPKWFNICAFKKNPTLLSANMITEVNDTAHQQLHTDIIQL